MKVFSIKNKLFLFVLFFCRLASADDIDLAKVVSDQHEETQKESTLSGAPIFLDAFEIFPEKWKAMVFVDVPFYSFYLGTPRVDGVAFLPNFNPDLGVSLGYMGATLRLIEPFRVLPDYESTRRGTSTKQDFILSASLHQFAIDIYSQYYRGFYISTPVTGLAGGQPQRYAQLPDTEVRNIGFNLYYALHPESYSMAAAFSQSEFQFKSGGSVIFNSYLNRLVMSPGSQFIAGTAPGADVKPVISAGTFWSGGVASGYGYTYSYKRYFATVQGLAGVGPQYQQLSDAGGNYERFNVQIKLNAAIAVGINRRYDFGGLQALADSIYGEIENGQLASTLVSAILYYGRRF